MTMRAAFTDTEAREYDHLAALDEADAARAEQEGAHAGPFSCAHPVEDHKPDEGCTWHRCGCWWVPLW